MIAKKRALATALGTTFTMLLANPVIGAETGEQQKTQQQQQMQSPTQSQQQMQHTQQQRMMQQTAAQIAYESDNLIGHEVVNLQGEELGTIRNLAIGSNGAVSYAVLGVGGFAGMRETQVAVPFSQLQISQDQDRITLNVSKDRVTSEFAAFEDIRKSESQMKQQQQEQQKQQEQEQLDVE